MAMVFLRAAVLVWAAGLALAADGTYAVGFRSSIEFDYGRRDVDGAGFRPVLVAVWYPAAGASGARMRYRDYLDIPDAGEFGLKLKRFGEERVTFDGESRGYRDAPVAAGRFPVVIYHPGSDGPFNENAVLFELLASDGYVVISSAYQMSTAHVSNNVAFYSRSLQDMRFLMQVAGRLAFAGVTKVAGVGHSYGAQSLLEWIGERECPLRAVVSLDTTFEYTPKNFPGHKEFIRNLEKSIQPVIPVMVFASAEKKPNFGKMDVFLKHAPRYEVSVPHLMHDDYVSHGALRADASAEVRASFGDVCATVKAFLDVVLRGRASLNAPAGVKVRYRAAQ